MIKVIGVRFRRTGKIYYFDPDEFEVKNGDNVIVETARGIEFGTVVGAPKEVENDKVIQPLKPVLRIANQRDIEQEAANKQKEKDAYKVCLEKIQKHNLDMKLIDAEYTFDKVLAIGGDTFTVGAPYVEGASVAAKVVKSGRGKKIYVFKYKAKKNEKKKIGHRQPYTKVQIVKIEG